MSGRTWARLGPGSKTFCASWCSKDPVLPLLHPPIEWLSLPGSDLSSRQPQAPSPTEWEVLAVPGRTGPLQQGCGTGPAGQESRTLACEAAVSG